MKHPFLLIIGFVIGGLCMNYYLNTRVDTMLFDCDKSSKVIGDDNYVFIVCRSTINDYI